MSYESTAEPIRVGYLMDFKLPANYPQVLRDGLTQPFDLVFSEGLTARIIDRPVEVIYRPASISTTRETPLVSISSTNTSRHTEIAPNGVCLS